MYSNSTPPPSYGNGTPWQREDCKSNQRPIFLVWHDGRYGTLHIKLQEISSQKNTNYMYRKSSTYQHQNFTAFRTCVCVDYLKLEKSKGGYENELVITCHFTRYDQAIATRNPTAKTTAEALFNHFIVHYGINLRLHSYQNAKFESKIIQELCHTLDINKSRTMPYHSMGNGLTERFNWTLIKMLGTLEN